MTICSSRNLEAGPCNFQAYLTTGESSQVSRVSKRNCIPLIRSYQTFKGSLEARAHATHTNSASNIDTCQCRRAEGRGRISKRRAEAGRYSN